MAEQIPTIELSSLPAPEEKQKYGNDIVVSEKQTLDWCDRLYLVAEPDHTSSSFQFSSEMLCVSTQSGEGRLPALSSGTWPRCLIYMRTTSSIEEDAITYARFNHYPHCPKPDQVLGLKPHTDATVITVVFIDGNVSGLQVQKNGFWHK
uniref:Protein SRG1 n=1 Tax=Aegilops tauschii TaxID=37682 RepID=M8C3L4_AEGTA